MIAPLLAAALLVQSAGAPPRAINGADWISESDYPDEARRFEREGRVAFTLAIDASGRVTGCTVTQSSGASSLDAATCRLIRARARFAPAKDAKGRTTAATFSSAVNWQLPPKPLEQVAAWSHLSRAVIDPRGKLLFCTTHSEGPVPADTGGFCEPVGKERAFALEMRGGPGASNATAFAQMRLSLDGVSYTAQHERLGVQLISLIAARFDIAETGAVENCTISERRGSLSSFQICRNVLGPFAPNRDAAGRPRKSRATVTLSFSKEGVPTAK